MLERAFETMAQKVANWAGQPPAFAIAAAVVVVWAVTGPLFHFSDTWQLVINTGTTIITFLMVFLIQNAQNRDGSAIQAKLDELIRALKGARQDFIGIEHATQKDLQKVLQAIESDCGPESSNRQSVERLIKRL